MPSRPKNGHLNFHAVLSWIKSHKLILGSTSLVFIIALIARLPSMSHGMDQWDVVLYKNSLVDMHFYRESQWPLLLFFQKGLWLFLPGFSPQEILSLTNIIFSSACVAMVFMLGRQLTRSYLIALTIAILLFFMPLFGVYSVVGMQDMPQTFAVTAFLAAAIQLIYSRQLKWLYTSSMIAGLALGVRPTLILLLPVLAISSVLMVGKKLRPYLKALAFLVVGGFIGLVGDLFITPLANSDPKGFFLSQFHQFNPGVLGYWVKAGDYPLFSGYRLTLFYWLPLIWFLVYLSLKIKQKRSSIGPVVALSAGLISLAVAFGLNRILKASPSSSLDFVEALVLFLCLAYEFIRFFPNLFNRRYLKDLSNREMAIIVIASLALIYIAFNYLCTGAVARYYLPIIPAIFLLFLLLINQHQFTRWLLVGLVFAFLFWARPFNHALEVVKAFNTLDPRSSVALYIKNHPGVYYDFAHSEDTHLESLGASKSVLPAFQNGCAAIDNSRTNYSIFYGQPDSLLLESCPQVAFVRIAWFHRNEEVIEDSLGNIGYTIYKIIPMRD